MLGIIIAGVISGLAASLVTWGKEQQASVKNKEQQKPKENPQHFGDWVGDNLGD